jgi:ABC-type taurine transport system substrate-binding protein
MVDATQTKELIDILEEVYDVSEETADIVKGAKTRVKEAKVMMKDYAEKNELSLKTINRLYTDYKSYRDNNSSWDEDDSYVELLVSITDALKEKE